MNTFAPIAVFAYKRPHHLAQAVGSLANCAEAKHSELTIYCDGPRRREDESGVSKVRAYASGVSGFKSIRVIQRRENYGLARSIITGVTELVRLHGRVIVVEDDLAVSPHFLQFMNDALKIYETDESVASIHGYTYPVDMPLPETFFMRGADCWGWATWERAWAHFQANGEQLLAELEARKLTNEFDFDGAFGYTDMLKDQVAGRNDSWAIRWHASCYLKDMLTLYPGHTLVENHGFDASGTHCGTNDDYSQALRSAPVRVARIPLTPSPDGRAAFKRFFQKRRSISSITRRIVNRLLPKGLRRENV